MSSSEFFAHKVFWERYRWGIEGDTAALALSLKGENVYPGAVKEHALRTGHHRVKHIQTDAAYVRSQRAAINNLPIEAQK